MWNGLCYIFVQQIFILSTSESRCAQAVKFMCSVSLPSTLRYQIVHIHTQHKMEITWWVSYEWRRNSWVCIKNHVWFFFSLKNQILPPLPPLYHPEDWGVTGFDWWQPHCPSAQESVTRKGPITKPSTDTKLSSNHWQSCADTINKILI